VAVPRWGWRHIRSPRPLSCIYRGPTSNGRVGGRGREGEGGVNGDERERGGKRKGRGGGK